VGLHDASCDHGQDEKLAAFAHPWNVDPHDIVLVQVPEDLGDR
jgi:hypothetical protein